MTAPVTAPGATAGGSDGVTDLAIAEMPISDVETELPPPPPLRPGVLRVVPLGGLGEVGRNMTAFEFGEEILVVDCGVLFPEEHQPGVDLILPDFSYLADRLEQVVAVVLTHGHEDHIGAVPFLLRGREDLLVVGSQLTLAFVAAKLREHRIEPVTQVVAEGERATFGAFECEFIAVNHSIPDALAVSITTPAGTVLHTGDFKMDQLPLDGRITDLRAFARVGEAGVDLFLVDSTNAEVPGFVTPEVEIAPVIDAVFAAAGRRIIVASFASHVHRVQQVLNAAAHHGRRVAFVGRSMVRNMEIAAQLGYLTVPDGVLIAQKKAADWPEDQLVYMSTGSQGEPMAALSRMASGEHPVKVGPGDTVILASSLIPGNENSVFRVINGLTRLGARVIHSGNAKVHVSGHAAAGELTYCYNIVRPRNVMPVHGEARQLVANGALAVRTGVPPERVVLAEDGVVVDLAAGEANIVGAVPCRYVYVDGDSVGEVTEAQLQERRVLGEEGFVSVVVVVDPPAAKVVGEVEFTARGMVAHATSFTGAAAAVTEAVEAALASGVRDRLALEQVTRRTVGAWVSRNLRRRPMLVPVVLVAGGQA